MKKLILLIITLLLTAFSFADTKGLNQIVTPYITPDDTFVLGYQLEHSQIGNPYQFQMEFGVKKNWEATIWQGMLPGQTTVALLTQLYQKSNLQVSAGTFYTFNTSKPQPFATSSYTKGNHFFVFGVNTDQTTNRIQSSLGYKYTFNDQYAFVTDYLQGYNNYQTIGFTYNPINNLQFNPAVYRSNGDSKLYPYLAISYSLKFK